MDIFSSGVCSARVTFFRDFDGKPSPYIDYDIIIPLDLHLDDALSFAEFSARRLLDEEIDLGDEDIKICDVMVSFKKSHQSAEDPSVLP